jgi:penicillin-binding protein 1A
MRRFANILVTTVLVLAAATAFLTGWFFGHYNARIDLPSQQELRALSAGTGICRAPGGQEFLDLDVTPALLRDAVLTAEDPDYFERPSVWFPGFDLIRGMFFERAGTSQSVAITAPVQRCLMSRSRQCWRTQLEYQVCGFMLAYRIQTTLSRRFIFELFLNETYYGRDAWGAAAAADAYFGKPLSDLTLDEAAFIAALPRAPSMLANNPQRATARRDLIIDRMQAKGVVTAEDAAAAKSRPLVLLPTAVPG